MTRGGGSQGERENGRERGREGVCMCVHACISHHPCCPSLELFMPSCMVLPLLSHTYGLSTAAYHRGANFASLPLSSFPLSTKSNHHSPKPKGDISRRSPPPLSLLSLYSHPGAVG